MEHLPAKIDEDVDLHNLIGSFGLDDIQLGVDNLVSAKWCYLAAVFTGLLVVVGYNLLIRYFAKVLIWLSVIGTGVAILALALVLNDYHANHYKAADATGNEDVGKILQIFIYVLYVLTGIYFLAVLCLYKDIAVSVAVLKTSAVIILGNMRVLLVPSIGTLIILTYVFGWGIGLCFLLSRGNITLPNEADDSQWKTINFDGKEELKW